MAEKQMTRLEPDPDVIEFLKRASEMVSQMPEWKQGMLEVSSLAFNSVPRPAVEPDESESNCPTR